MRWEIATLARDLDFVPQRWEKMRVASGTAREAGLAWVREVGLRTFGADSPDPAGMGGGSGANGGRA